MKSFFNFPKRSHIGLEKLTLHVFRLKIRESCVVFKLEVPLAPLRGPSGGISDGIKLDAGLMLGDCRDNLAFVVLASLILTWASSFRAMCGLNWIRPMFLIPFHLSSA